MPMLVIALAAAVAGWAAAAWLAYRLIIARGRLLLQGRQPSSSPEGGAGDTDDRERQEIPRTFLPQFDLHIDREHTFFLHALAEARALKQAGAQFRRGVDGQLLCEVGGITVFVRSVEEMRILHEVFVRDVYSVRVSGPAVVWDIGMNVGVASLYFAARGNVRVVGYEPIGTTYQLALENLALNPSLRDLITTVNSGVGGSNRTEMVDYCDELKGSVGLFGAVADPFLRHVVLNLSDNAVIRKVPLRLEDAVSVFASVHAANPDVPVIAKIDCEGAEYEIIEALHRSGDLSSLHALMIEWHSHGPEPLSRHLSEAGFTVFSLDSIPGRWGRLYAVRAPDHRSEHVMRP